MRKVGVGLAGILVLLLSVGALTWITRTAGPATRVVSNEGGFSLEVPRRWSVEHRTPTKDHADFLIGHEKALLPFWQRGGFWVSRWAVGDAESTESIQARVRREQAESPRDNWTASETHLAGQAAVRRTFTESPPDFGGKLRLGQRRVVVYDLAVRGFNYQVGLWTLPHAGSVTSTLDKIATSLELFAPRPWTLDVGDTDTRLTLPAGWAPTTSDLSGVALYALAPGDPTSAWVYIFNYTDSPAATLRGALRKIPSNGGTITGQHPTRLAGRAATRLDFTFPDEGHPPASDVEWFVSDGDGGTLVLAVGRRSGDPTIAERIARSWKF
jgi:hypothetical protein